MLADLILVFLGAALMGTAFYLAYAYPSYLYVRAVFVGVGGLSFLVGAARILL